MAVLRLAPPRHAVHHRDTETTEDTEKTAGVLFTKAVLCVLCSLCVSVVPKLVRAGTPAYSRESG